MIDPAALFASVAQSLPIQVYFDGAVLGETPAVYAGGSIVTPGQPTERPCKVQIDKASWDMRQAEGYVEGSMLCLIPVETLAGALDTDARVRVDGGPHVGTWLVSGIQKDSLGIYWQGSGVAA